MTNLADCYATLDGSLLRVGNPAVERAWDLSMGAPAVTSVRDKARGREWACEAPYRDALRRSDLPLREAPSVDLATQPDDFRGACEEHLRATVTLAYAHARVTWTLRVWPDLPVVLSQFRLACTAPGPELEPEPFYDSGGVHLHMADDRTDFFGLAPRHLAWHVTEFVCQSDYHDNLVLERQGFTYPKENIRERGALLHLVDRVDGGGLAVFKLAPPWREALHHPGWDFVLSGCTLAVTGTGITPQELATGEPFDAYPTALGVTDGSPGAMAELCYRLDRARIRPNPARTFAVMSNTWGAGQGSKRLNEKMFAQEIATGARLGLTHCQMDAGWMEGQFASLNVEGNRPKGPYGILPDFWDVNADKFPRGLEPLVALARDKGVRLGFWFSPDGTGGGGDYANWERDRDVILHMWRAYGMRAVKIDGVSVHAKCGEANLLRLFESVYEGSNRELSINFDITGGKSRRLGHFYGNEFTGNLFIENRYARDGTYYPYRTTRSLWQLCRYLPSYRLHMEFVDAHLMEENYPADDPLRPAAFGTEYSCAAVLFANPLCWMEVQHLTAEDKRRLRRLLRAYRPHQKAILLGRVRPIGEMPTGRAWTGFQSVTGPGTGYLMLLREATDRPEAAYRLHDVPAGGTLDVERLAGASRMRRLRVDDAGRVRVRLPGPRTYAFLKYAAR